MISKTKAFRQLMIIDNTAEYIKFNFQKSSAETIHIVKDRENWRKILVFPSERWHTNRCHDLARSSKSVMDLRASMFSFSFETDLHIPELYLFPTAYSAFPQHICVALKKKKPLKLCGKLTNFRSYCHSNDSHSERHSNVVPFQYWPLAE